MRQVRFRFVEHLLRQRVLPAVAEVVGKDPGAQRLMKKANTTSDGFFFIAMML